MMTETVKAAIRALSRRTNLEICGFILSGPDGPVIEPAKNCAEIPASQFRFEAAEYLRQSNSGKLIGLYHSHPSTSSALSTADKVLAESYQLPLAVYSVPEDAFDLYQPNGYTVPLVGRSFVLGCHDCANLVLDYYRQELKLELPELDHSLRHLLTGWSGFRQYFGDNGFVAAQIPQKHDVLLMALGESKGLPNHAGIYLGDGRMLHQLMGRVSEYTHYGRYWQDRTVYIAHHA